MQKSITRREQQAKYHKDKRLNDPEYRQRLKEYNTQYVRNMRIKKRAEALATLQCMFCQASLHEQSDKTACAECRAKKSRKYREWRQARKDNQLCIACGTPIPDNHQNKNYCPAHTQRYIEKDKERKAKGICTHCGKLKEENEKGVRCGKCRVKSNSRTKELRDLNRSAGKCSICGAELPEGQKQKTCHECRIKEKIRKRNAYQEGYCIRCQTKTVEQPNRKQCNRCLDIMRLKTQTYIDKLTAENKCSACAVSLEGIDRKYKKNPICIPCYQKIQQSAKQVRIDRYKKGLCTRCGIRNAEPARKSCPNCRAINRIETKTKRDKKRARELAAQHGE